MNEIKKIFYNIDDNKEMYIENENINLINQGVWINPHFSNEEIIKLKEMLLTFKPKSKKEKVEKLKKEPKPKKELKHIIVEPKPKKEKVEKPKKEAKIKEINRDENNKPLKFTCGCGGVYTHLSKWCHNQSQKHKHFEEKGEILKKTCFNFTKKDLSPEELEKRKEWYRNYTKTHKFPKKKKDACKDLISNLEVNVPNQEDEILKNIINLISGDKPPHPVD
jgi:hypothetical protein